MMKRLACLAATLFLIACGGSDESGDPTTQLPPGSPPLNTALAGTWYGTTSAAFASGGGISYSSHLVIAVSGTTASVAKVCPDGSQSVQVQGTGNTAAWSGSVVCPAISLDACSSVRFTYTQATATLGTNGVLTVVATANGSGCGTNTTATVTFTGSK